MYRIKTLILVAVSAALIVGCGDGAPNRPADGTVGDRDGKVGNDGGPPPGKKMSFVKEGIDIENAAEATAITTGGGKIGLAYYRRLDQPKWPTVTCQATFSGGGGPKARPGHDLIYIESTDDGATWSQPVKVSQTINAVFGLSIAIGGGKTYIGYLGGPQMSLQECASSDAMIASSSDGKTWTDQTVLTQGGVGDSVGHWMSVALDSSGQIQAAYRDVRFGLYEQSGNTKSSARYGATGEAVADQNGGGIYATLRFDDRGRPLVMHYNPHQTDGSGGIQLVIKDGGSWVNQQLVAGATNERPAFETDGKGTFALADYSPAETSLKYIESKDLKTWTTPITVDISTTRNGEFASMAFDSSGNPAIAYYRCAKASSTSGNCSTSEDGLMFAYRIGGKWKTYEVDTGDAFSCGDQTSLTFNASDEPVIAYRCVTLRNQGNKFVSTLKIARGVWK